MIVSCETSDNQIDFSLLTYKVKERTHIIKQTSEVVKREMQNPDPIVDFKAVFTHDWPFAIARRASAQVDFYWNYSRIGTDDKHNLSDRFVSVQLNFEGFYLE